MKYFLETRNMRNSKYLIFMPLSYMFMIFIMSSIPGDSDIFTRGMLSNLIPTVQNLLHVPLFGLLAFLWIITFKLWLHTEKLSIGMAVIISVNYGFLDEVYQYFIPGRYMSFTDIYLDILGVFSAIGMYKLFFKKHFSTFEHSIN